MRPRRRLLVVAALLAAAVVPALAGAKAGGGRDASFGAKGAVVTPFAGSAAAVDLLVQPDGGLVAVGTALNPDAAFAAARYRSDGTLDLSFGTGGTVESHSPGRTERALGGALDAQGRLVVVG